MIKRNVQNLLQFREFQKHIQEKYNIKIKEDRTLFSLSIISVDIYDLEKKLIKNSKLHNANIKLMINLIFDKGDVNEIEKFI